MGMIRNILLMMMDERKTIEEDLACVGRILMTLRLLVEQVSEDIKI
jgi:hypothetical protein